jgi:hypothetical protein
MYEALEAQKPVKKEAAVPPFKKKAKTVKEADVDPVDKKVERVVNVQKSAEQLDRINSELVKEIGEARASVERNMKLIFNHMKGAVKSIESAKAATQKGPFDADIHIKDATEFIDEALKAFKRIIHDENIAAIQKIRATLAGSGKPPK